MVHNVYCYAFKHCNSAYDANVDSLFKMLGSNFKPSIADCVLVTIGYGCTAVTARLLTVTQSVLKTVSFY